MCRAAEWEEYVVGRGTTLLTSRCQVEANYLNERIFKRLSITSVKDDVEDDINDRPPLILTESSFSEKDYGSCLQNYKRRLQLDDERGPSAHGDLTFLVNVTMSPWPTDPDFLSELAKSFRKIAEEEVKVWMTRSSSAQALPPFLPSRCHDHGAKG